MGFVADFKAFALRGNVVDLAVGVIIGAAFGSIVTALVNDIIMPPIGVLTSGIDFKEQYYLLTPGKGPQPYASLAAAKAAGASALAYGDFLNTLINFLIVAFVIFLVVRQMAKLFPSPPAPVAGPTTDQKLLTEIRDLLARDVTATGGAPTTSRL